MIRLQNVTYLVRDLDDAIGFFSTGLGFTVRQDETFVGGRRRVVVGPAEGGTGLVLAVSDADTVGHHAGGDVAFFLETDDFTAAHDRLVAAGARFREPPRREPYGTVAVFEDPTGMPWDLIEPPTTAPVE